MLGKSLKIASVLLLMAAVAAAQSIPAGTRVTVRMGSGINSGTARSGQMFDATLARDLVVNGKTLAKAGAPAHGKVTYAKSSGRLHDPGELSLRLTSVEVNGRNVPVSTTAFHAKGKSHTKSNLTKIGGGAAAGALIGGLSCGGKGALIWTAVRACARTGASSSTCKHEAVVHSECNLTVTMTAAAIVK